MSNTNEFMLNIIAKVNKQLSKRAISGDLKTLDNTMHVKVLAKLSKTLASREIKRQLKELDNLYVNVGIRTDKGAKDKIQKNIRILQQSIEDIEIGLEASKQQQKKLDSQIEGIRKNIQKKVSSAPLEFSLQIKKDKLISDIEYTGKRFSKLFSSEEAAKKYQAIMQNALSVTDKGQLSDTRAELAAFTSELKASDLASKSTSDRWKELTARAKDLFSAASVVRAAFEQVKEAVKTTIDLDKVFTDLVKVQPEVSRNDYPEYLDMCNRKAQELASTQKALIEGATEFSKSGYDLNTSNELAEKSTILANVGEMSASDSAKAIISGVQAYDEIGGYTDTIDKASELIDRYNRLGNEASITTAELAKGVQSVGSVFADSNTSVEQFLSLLSAGNRAYQNADSLALALRTSALRIRGASVELEESGEDIEGVMSTLDNQKAIKTLTGVDILETDGQTIRSIYDIFLDISKVYKDMSDVDQSALLDIIAGKHRASAISATLNNMTEAEELLQKSLHSAGSAQKEYDTYLGSTEAHLQQFQAKLVETYSTFINGDMISHAADLGTSILDLVNKTDLLKHSLIAIAAIKIGQGVTTVGGVIASTVTQMKTLGGAIQQVENLNNSNIFREDALDELGYATQSLTEKNLKLLLSQKQLEENDRVRILQAHNLTEEQAREKLEKLGLTDATNANTAANTANTVANKANTASVNGLKGALTGLKTSAQAAWAAMSTLERASIIFAVISTMWSIGTSFVNGFKQKQEEAAQALEDAVSEYESAKSSLESINNELAENQKRLDELLAKDKLTYAEKGELEKLQEITKELLLQQDIEEKRAGRASKDVANKTVDAYKKQYGKYEGSEDGLKNMLSNDRFPMPEDTDDVLGNIAAYTRAKELLEQSQKDYENALNNGEDTSWFAENLQYNIDMVDDFSDLLNDNISDLEEKRAILEEAYNKSVEKRDLGVEPLSTSDQEIIDTYESIYAAIKMVYEYTDPNKWKSIQIEDVFHTQGIEKTKQELISLAEEGSLTPSRIASEFPKLNDAVKESEITVQEFCNEINASADAAKEAMGNLTDAELPKISSLSELLGQSAGEGDDTHTDAINKYRDSIASLQAYLEKFSTGDYTNDDMISLATEFGITGDSADDLSNQIRDLMDLDMESVTRLLNNLLDTGNVDGATRKSVECLKQSLIDLNHEAQNIDIKFPLTGDVLSDVERLSEGLDQLGAVYEDVKNKEDFDWSSILNNEGFEKAFSAYTDEYNNFIDTVSDSPTDIDACQDAFNALATAYINGSGALRNVTQETKNATIAMLEQMGITNASEIVTAQLAAQELYLKLNMDASNDSIYQQISELMNHSNASNVAYSSLFQLVAQERIFANTSLNSASKILELEKLARSFGIVADSIYSAQSYIDAMRFAGTYGGKEAAEEVAQSYVSRMEDQIAAKFANMGSTYKPQVPSSGGGSKSKSGSDSKASESKTTIDWIERKLDSLQKKIDATKAKFENLFTVKSKSKNIDKQIAQTKKLLSATEKAAKKYKAYADKITFSKDPKKDKALKEKVQSGDYSIKDYDSKTAEKIRKYEGYYDKYKDLQKQVDELETQNRESEKEKLQLYVDDAEAKIDRSKAHAELDEGNYKEQNKHLEAQKKYQKESYKYQIKIAELEKDSVKASQLKAELKKEIRDLTEQEYQNIVDDAESKIDRSQAYAELDAGDYKEQNKHLEAQKKNLKQSYDYQIKIAKLNKDDVEASRLKAEYQKELRDLAKAEFDNIENQFELELFLLSHEADMISLCMDKVEALGHVIGKSYYSKLITQEKENIEVLNEEYAALQEALNAGLGDGSIKKYSEQWYEMCGSINDVQKALKEANLSIIEYNNSIRQLDWDAFDRAEDYISQVQSEADFLTELMSDKKLFHEDSGQWTEYATATGGLHAVNYNAYMSQADDYAREIQKINKDLADDPYNTVLIERKQELIRAQQEAIKSAESEKQAIKDLVADGYNVMIDALQEIIDKRKEALDAQKDLYDYEKNISKQTKNILNLEKQRLALQGDNSEEAKAQLQQITVKLDEARDDLDETEYEQWRSDQEKMLDGLVDNVQEWVNQRLDNIEGLLSDVIARTNSNASEIQSTLEQVGNNVGYSLTDAMENIWDTNNSVVTTYGDAFSSQLTSVNTTLESIRNFVESMATASDLETFKDQASDRNHNSLNSNALAGLDHTAIDRTQLSGTTHRISTSNVFTGKEEKISNTLTGKTVSQSSGTGSGSFSSSNVSSTKSSTAKMTSVSSSRSGWGSLSTQKKDSADKVNSGSTIPNMDNQAGGRLLSIEEFEALYYGTSGTGNQLSKMSEASNKINPVVGSMNSYNQMPEFIRNEDTYQNRIDKVDVDINLPNVSNYEEFVSRLVHDTHFEKTLQEMTLGRALGHNRYNKFRV